MTPFELAIFIRAGWRCAWCACDLRMTKTTADQPRILRLDVTDGDSSTVASCCACALEYARWWPNTCVYSVENAKRALVRHNGSGPFVDYLERATEGRGYLRPFYTALARIEAQRHVPLDLVAAKAALDRRAA